jgi:putative redox protein
MATALANCILTTMAIVGDIIGVKIDGAHAEVIKSMSSEKPRRIASLPVTVHMPAGIDPKFHEKLENAARQCPVHKSLHPDIQAEITINWA